MSIEKQEAIGVVRSFIDKLAPEHKEALSSLLPELSESEDERTRKHIIEILDSLAPCHWNGNEKSKCIAYLEKQKEQKPADIPSAGSGAWGTTPPGYKLDVKPVEWSEEDEMRRKQTIGVIEGIDKYGWNVNDADRMDIKIVLNWLKSLRPQPYWKPSKEQMEAVKCAAADVRQFSKSWEDKIENEGYYKALVSLLDDLKKLV